MWPHKRSTICVRTYEVVDFYYSYVRCVWVFGRCVFMFVCDCVCFQDQSSLIWTIFRVAFVIPGACVSIIVVVDVQCLCTDCALFRLPKHTPRFCARSRTRMTMRRALHCQMNDIGSWLWLEKTWRDCVVHFAGASISTRRIHIEFRTGTCLMFVRERNV